MSSDDQILFDLLSERQQLAEQELAAMRQEAASLERRIVAAERSLAAMQTVSASLATGPGDGESTRDAAPTERAEFVPGVLGSNPSPSDGIAELLRLAGPRGMSFQELFDEFERRDWINPENTDPKTALRAALNRLRRANPDLYYSDRRRTFLRTAAAGEDG